MKNLTLGIIAAIVLLSVGVIAEVLYDEEKEYERQLESISYNKNLCESAGFIFEQEGELINKSAEQKQDGFFVQTGNIGMLSRVTLKCYKLNNDVRIYQNWRSMIFDNDAYRD